MQLRAPSKPGPAAAASGPARVLISVTEYTPDRRADWPAIALAAHRLRRHWPDLDGALWLWLWIESDLSRGGSVSIWEAEAGLKEFVRWPPHLEIMRRFRARGSLRSTTWVTGSLEPAEIWATARAWLATSPLVPDRPP